MDVLLLQNPPWQLIQQNESGSVTQYSGLIFDVIKELSKSLNFTYTIHVVHMNWTKPKNATLAKRKYRGDILDSEDILTNIIPTSIIDLIQNKTMALGAIGFTVSEEHKEFIDFTNPINIQTYTFLAARPRELSRALLFMSPFTFDVSTYTLHLDLSLIARS